MVISIGGMFAKKGLEQSQPTLADTNVLQRVYLSGLLSST